MERCTSIKQLLFRVSEGEATPDEALRVARHVSACTVCRILLAREHRLARLLEQDLDDLQVGDDFVRSVMATLPDRPVRDARQPRRDQPAQARGRSGRRGLKLAGLLGFVGAWSWALTHEFGFPGAALLPALPELTFQSFDHGPRDLPALVQALWIALGTLIEQVRHVPPALAAPVDFLALTCATAALLGLLGTSTVLICAAGYLARTTPGWINKS